MAAVRSPSASADGGLQRSETALALPKQLDGWRQLAAPCGIVLCVTCCPAVLTRRHFMPRAAAQRPEAP